MSNTICTIGFSKKNLRRFVSLLQDNKVTKLIDTRLNNTSQLAGYSKKEDLEYILELHKIKYIHDSLLAPTKDILKDYKQKLITWEDYEKRYINLLKNRNIEGKIEEIIGYDNDTICLLCSEDKPHHCHRRLLAEFIKQHHNKTNIQIVHLV
jgi:uncharacterized protein (DUF488 family)